MSTSKFDTKSILIAILTLVCVFLLLNQRDSEDLNGALNSLQQGETTSIVSPSDVQHTELDAYWAESSRTVREGDFEAYADSYHEDAVLVNGIRGTSYAISEALDGWKEGFDDTRDGKMTAAVDFRFSERLISENTAHETGIFRYTSQMEGEEESVALIHFQSLTVKKDGRWVMMMEYQIATATDAEWTALAPN